MKHNYARRMRSQIDRTNFRKGIGRHAGRTGEYNSGFLMKFLARIFGGGMPVIRRY